MINGLKKGDFFRLVLETIEVYRFSKMDLFVVLVMITSQFVVLSFLYERMNKNDDVT